VTFAEAMALAMVCVTWGGVGFVLGMEYSVRQLVRRGWTPK
jgi:hypothetical protein